MKKILLIGPYPPPIGGVSIHIQRLEHLLKKKVSFEIADESRIIKKDILNIRSKNLIQYIKLVRESDIIHIHSGVFILRIFHIIICRFICRKYTVVTIHHDPTVEKFVSLTKWFISKCNHTILVNEKGYKMMKTNSDCKYHLIPAFLPPIIENEPNLPDEISCWINNKKELGYDIFVSNAWNLLLHDGIDLYGLDLCIDAFKELKKQEKKCCLIFIVASNSNQQDLMIDYKKRIHEYGIEDIILIWEKPLSFVRLIKDSDFVLRTTNTDGDALSIREALYLNKPIIASDVVMRPKGVFLFHNRDINSLLETINKCITTKGDKMGIGEKDYITEYYDIYSL